MSILKASLQSQDKNPRDAETTVVVGCKDEAPGNLCNFYCLPTRYFHYTFPFIFQKKNVTFAKSAIKDKTKEQQQKMPKHIPESVTEKSLFIT